MAIPNTSRLANEVTDCLQEDSTAIVSAPLLGQKLLYAIVRTRLAITSLTTAVRLKMVGIGLDAARNGWCIVHAESRDSSVHSMWRPSKVEEREHVLVMPFSCSCAAESIRVVGNASAEACAACEQLKRMHLQHGSATCMHISKTQRVGVFWYSRGTCALPDYGYGTGDEKMTWDMPCSANGAALAFVCVFVSRTYFIKRPGGLLCCNLLLVREMIGRLGWLLWRQCHDPSIQPAIQGRGEGDR